MDSFASGAASTSSFNAHLGQAMPQDLATTTFIIIAAVVWLLEMGRRGGGLQAAGCARALHQVAPELLGLVGMAAFAAMCLAKGGNKGAPIATPEDQELWLAIQAEWPVLTTADSLLAVQAMMRLVLLTSAALRVASPLAGLPAAYCLLAAASRVTLLALSPKDVYHLDGPLGGSMNGAFEAAALVPLLCLSRGVGWRRALFLLSSSLLAAWAAWNNHLGLAQPGQSYLDALFSLEELLEFLGAVACLASAVAAVADGEGAPSLPAPSALVQCLLPLQQLLPAYFMLTAWGAAPFQVVPELVGAGRPFEVLQGCGVAQVGIYLLVAVLRLAFSNPEPKEAPGQLLEGRLFLEV